MSHRLRLYFGAGRSNTAPEMEELDGEAQDDAIMTFHMPPGRRGLPSFADGGSARPGEALLKRSSSMFIPQLSSQQETRPTKSSTMQISLQRGMGIADTGVSEDWSTKLNHSPVSVCGGSPTSPLCHNGSSGSANGDSTVVNVGAFCIQRKSADFSDVQQVRILPYGPDSQNTSHYWSVQQNMDGAPGTKRVVLQLQQDQRRPAKAALWEDAGVPFAGIPGEHVQQYPRIRLERSASQPLQPSGTAQPMCCVTKGQAAKLTNSNVDGQKTNVGDAAQGCTFKIMKEQSRRQPQFKIYFTQGGERDQALSQDTDLEQSQSRISPQVKHEKAEQKFRKCFLLIHILCFKFISKAVVGRSNFVKLNFLFCFGWRVIYGNALVKTLEPSRDRRISGGCGVAVDFQYILGIRCPGKPWIKQHHAVLLLAVETLSLILLYDIHEHFIDINIWSVLLIMCIYNYA